MAYEIKKFDHLFGLPGLSDGLLSNHFALYEGYVNNVSKLSEALGKLEKEGGVGGSEYSELKRRFGWEWNGMRLHELYFENLTKISGSFEPDSEISRKINEQFGSFADWEKAFRATAAMRGIGWAILHYDRGSGRLFNSWIGEHDSGHLAGAEPILILDVFEHAHYPDFGRDRAKYLDVLMPLLDWGKISARLSRVISN